MVSARSVWILSSLVGARAAGAVLLPLSPRLLGARPPLSTRLKSIAMSSSSQRQPECGSSVASSLATERKGRVLMLHGWAQNASVMRMKTKTLTRKLNQAGYDCVFVEAPHLLPLTSTVDVDGEQVELENGKRENARAWFLLSKTDPADATKSQSGISMEYYGLDESLAMIETEIKACRRSDTVAVLGFSQGGVFAHILARLATLSRQENVFAQIGAVIVASGFAAQHVWPKGAKYAGLRMPERDAIHLPSLHLIGKKDTSVVPELSLDLVRVFVDAATMMHEKGHIIPQKSADCATIVSFLDRIKSTDESTS